MAKLVLILSIAFAFAAAGLGLATKGRVDALQEKFRDTTQKLSSTQSELTTSKKNLDKTQTELAGANKTLEERNTEIAALKTSADEAKRRADALDVQVKDKEAQIAQLNTQLESMKTNPVAAPQDDAAKVALEEQLKKAQAELAEAKQVQDTYIKRADDAANQLASANSELERYRKQVARPGIRGEVLAYNAGWNFAVVSVGDRSGAVVNTPLLVMRGNQPIARLRITSVEPNQSIADVVPGSMSRGQTLQPGDAVIYSGRAQGNQPQGQQQQQQQQATPPAPSAPAAGQQPPQ